MKLTNLVSASILLLLSTIISNEILYAQREMNVSPKFSVDVSGNHEASAGETTSLNVKTAFSLGIEVLRNSENMFNFGAGLTYQIPRELDIPTSENFNFIPIYIIGKIAIVKKSEEENIIPSLMINLGYNVIYNGNSNYKGPFSLTGGLYLGGGLRVDIENFFLEALYKSFNGKASYSSLNINVTYTTFAIGAGVSL